MWYNLFVQIKTLELTNFRNYSSARLNLDGGLNVLIGKNAQGKTNLLESIYFAGLGHSARTPREKELIKWETALARVKAALLRRDGERSIEMILPNSGKKTVKINNLPIKRLGELMGELPLVYFSPDELRLVKEAPSDRRRFLDIDISQLSKVYFYSLQRYNKILAQRNALLKQKKDKVTTKQTISIWNEALAKNGANVILARLQFLNELKIQAAKIHAKLTNNKEKLEIFYSGLVGGAAGELVEKLQAAYVKSFEKDYELGFTTVGPHRDDLILKVNGADIRAYGSQGQQRTAALSLKLAELEIFKAQYGEYPVLLLDDVLSELDETRANQLLKAINGIQTILTCTSFNYKVDYPYKLFTIEGGKIAKQETKQNGY